MIRAIFLAWNILNLLNKERGTGMSNKNVQKVPDLQFNYSSQLNPADHVLEFNGQTSVSMESVENFPVAGLTVSCRVKSSDTQTDVVLFSYDAKPGDNSQRLWLKNPANLEIGFGDSGSGPTGVKVNDNCWHHIAFTLQPWDSTHYAAALFKDGVSMFRGIGAISHPADKELENLGKLELGHGVGQENGFTGLMSEFRLWNGVRSDNEIISDMQVRMSGSTGGIVICWALESAQTSGTVKNGQFVNSDLRFRTIQLLAQWNEISEATYDLEVEEIGGCWIYKRNNLTTLQDIVNGYFINKTYRAKVRAVVSGTPGSWSTPQTVAVVNLQQVCPQLTHPEALRLVAEWLPLDQAANYQVNWYKNQETNPDPSSGRQTDTSLDLTTKMQSPETWRYEIMGFCLGSFGPGNPTTTLTDIHLSLVYINTPETANKHLEASWNAQTGVDFYYLKIIKKGTPETIVYQEILTGDTTSKQFIGTFADGDIYYAQVRGIAAGTLGTWALSSDVVIHNLVAPIISSVLGNIQDHTIKVDWDFDNSQLTGAGYVAELWRTNGQEPFLTSPLVEEKTYTFTNENIVENASFKVRVQVKAGGSVGLWSEFTPVCLSALPQVTGVNASVNIYGDITVNWTAVSGVSDVRYRVELSGPRSIPAKEGIADTAITFKQSDTHVQEGETYRATVWSTKDSDVSCPSVQTQESTVTVGEIHEVPPPNQNNQPEVADPINVSAGTYGYSHVDIEVHGVFPLQFITYYDTSCPTPGENPLYNGKPMGIRWNHSYNTRLVKNQQAMELYVLWGNGQIDVYSIPSSITGIYPVKGIPKGDRLFLGSDMRFVLTRKHQDQYIFTFDGLLQTITSPSGNTVSLGYNSENQLERVTDNQGQYYLSIAYNGEGCVRSVTDNSGRAVTYEYLNGNLHSMTDVMGNSRTFNYTGESLVETIVDENGNTALKNVYTDGKVTFQQDGRALAAGETYGSSFQYQVITENGIEIVVTDYVDRAGNQVQYKTVKANGNTLSEVYQLGNEKIRKVTHTYDGFNNKLTETIYEGPASEYQEGAGNTFTYTYDGNNNLESVTDPLDRVESYGYDENNNLNSFTDVLGNATIYHYENNLLMSITDPLGRTYVLSYKPGSIKGLVETIQDVLGNTTSFEYYDNGNLKNVINPLQGKTHFEYDQLARPQKIQVIDSQQVVQRTTLYEYWNSGNVKKLSQWLKDQPQAEAYVDQYDYNGVGDLITRTDPEQHAVTYRYDANDRLESTIYPEFAGITRSIGQQYDRIDNLKKVLYSPEVVEQYVYDIFGRLLTFTDPMSNVYQYQYDDILDGSVYSHQITKTFPPLASEPGQTYSQVAVYDAAFRLISLAERGAQQPERITYSQLGEPHHPPRMLVVTREFPPENPGEPSFARQTIYDALGRVVSEQNEADRITTYVYRTYNDPVSNTVQEVITVLDPLGNQLIYNLDALGRVVKILEGKDQVTRTRNIEYDVLDRVVRVGEIREQGEVNTHFTYQYDSATRHIHVAITRPGEEDTTTVQEYNGLSQLVRETDALQKSCSHAYTPWGAVCQYVDGKNQVLRFDFDAAGRFYKITLPNGSDTIEHNLDNNGNRLHTRMNQDITINRTFDLWNRLLSRTDSQNKAVQYEYYPHDRLKTLTYPDGGQVEYAYNGLNRLKTVTDWNTRVTRYSYWPAGQMKTMQFANGVSGNFQVDEAGRLTGIEYRKDNFILFQENYTLDSLGNRKIENAILPLPVNIPGDNRVFTYNNANQMITMGSQNLSYDDNGSLQALPLGGQLQPLQYNAFNQVTQMGNDIYTYDEDGLRLSGTAAGITRYFVQDVNGYQSPRYEMGDESRALIGSAPGITPLGSLAEEPMYGEEVVLSLRDVLDRVLEISNDAGAVLYRYVYGMGLINQEDANGDYRVYLFDSRGSSLARTDSEGNIVDRYAYSPDGQVSGVPGNGFNPFLYNGRDGVTDDNNGLLYMRSRYYSPQLARFLQKDYLFGNIHNPQTLNRYAFGRGNPVSYIDPLGLTALRDLAFTVVIGGELAVLGFLLYKSGALGKLFGLFSSISSGLGNLFRGLRGVRYNRVPTAEPVTTEPGTQPGQEIEMQPITPIESNPPTNTLRFRGPQIRNLQKGYSKGPGSESETRRLLSQSSSSESLDNVGLW